MKFRHKKHIRIGEYVFKVQWDRTHDGGWFDYGKKIINIGIKGYSSSRTLSVIIHELKEIVQINQFVRYVRPDTEKEYEFHYNHKEHSAMCNELAGLLDELIK